MAVANITMVKTFNHTLLQSALFKSVHKCKENIVMKMYI